ncbi:MAG TPA: hypothetical protein VGQ69_03430 [Gemmatimonadales bacterium]|jgi:hypothetical protein|nr:hypothetical protein [Gemmatimonadales bacterium]
MGKYLTNTTGAAARWGADAALSAGSEGFEVWRITVSADTAKTFRSLGRIDGIGEAWWATIESLAGAKLELVKRVVTTAVK